MSIELSTRRLVSAKRARRLRRRGEYVWFSHVTSTGKARYSWRPGRRGLPAEPFTSQVQGVPLDISQLRAVVREYYTRTEAYDRTVCHGPIVNGAIMPATTQEHATISLHAAHVEAELKAKAVELGFSERDFFLQMVAEGLVQQRAGAS